MQWKYEGGVWSGTQVGFQALITVQGANIIVTVIDMTRFDSISKFVDSVPAAKLFVYGFIQARVKGLS